MHQYVDVSLHPEDCCVLYVSSWDNIFSKAKLSEK